jgi:hypothetical protein
MTSRLVSVATAMARFALGEQRYTSLNVFDARSRFRGIERIRGKTPARDIRLCNEYAVEVLGGRRFAPWLHVYSAVAREFREGWIPQSFYDAIVAPQMQGHYGAISSLKPLNKVILSNENFPDLLSYVNGLFIDGEGKPISAADVKARLFREHDRVVYKLDRSYGGKAIHIFDRESFDVHHATDLGNGLFQSYIKQHAVFDRFHAGAVATLRIGTIYEDDGTVSPRGCYLRFANPGEVYVRGDTEIRVPIDLATGAFSEIGYMGPLWEEIPAHPASNAVFRDNVLPAFKECVSTVVGLHRTYPYTRHIGWDLAVDTEEKVRVMEWNGYSVGIMTIEMTQGPCFADLGWEKLRYS